LSTSATARKIPERQKLLLADLIVSLFTALFGAVYELFGHGVYSYGMIYAFAFPLVLGVLPLMLIGMLHRPAPGRVSKNLYHAGIASLTVGSIVSGALEIYGTTNPLTLLYWVLGTALVLAGAAAYLIPLLNAKRIADGR